jgi:peptidyl-prolyl cis-trans isomerase SurA
LGRFYFVIAAISLSMVACPTQAGERQPLDRIVAIVGEDLVLASDLAQQMQLTVLQTGRRPQNEDEVKKFQTEVLDQMVSDLLFLQEAKKDTSIHVRSEEVDEALSEQMQRVAGRFKSNDEFLDALQSQGLKLNDLKKKYRQELQDQLIKQRLIQKKLSSISVSRHEVEEFYEKYKDSIPAQPEGIRLAHILLKFAPSRKVDDSVKALANDVRLRMIKGEDFATLSTKFSSPGAAPDSGELGYMSKEDLVPEFARAAWNLKDGDISGVVRTEFGYHVIKCEGHRGEKLKLRHLLLFVQPSAADSAALYHLADSLLTQLRAGADFAETAKTWSNDDESRVKDGELGWFSLKQMPAEFADSVKDWKTPNEYRGPVISPNGLHILKLLEYQEEKRFTLAADYDKLKELARQDKTGRLVDKWVGEIKARSFVEYRLDALNAN